MQESDDKSRRIKRKAQELARDGKIGGGGTRPFGFEDDRKTIRVSEAAVVIEASERVLAGESVRSVCFDLNRRGITTRHRPRLGSAGPYPDAQVGPASAASGNTEGEIVADAEWPGIIPRLDGNRLRAFLSDPARRKNERAAPLSARGDAAMREVRRSAACPALAKTAAADTYVLVAPTPTPAARWPSSPRSLRSWSPEWRSTGSKARSSRRALAAQNGSREDEHQRAVDEAAEQLEELGHGVREPRGHTPRSGWRRGRPSRNASRGPRPALARSNGTSAVAEFVGNAHPARRLEWTSRSVARRAILAAVLDHVTIQPGPPRLQPLRPGARGADVEGLMT